MQPTRLVAARAAASSAEGDARVTANPLYGCVCVCVVGWWRGGEAAPQRVCAMRAAHTASLSRACNAAFMLLLCAPRHRKAADVFFAALC